MAVILIALCPCFYDRARRRGEIFSVRDPAEARTLIAVGHAQEYRPQSEPEPEPEPEPDPEPEAPRARRTYRRRDLTAEVTEG